MFGEDGACENPAAVTDELFENAKLASRERYLDLVAVDPAADQIDAEVADGHDG